MSPKDAFAGKLRIGDRVRHVPSGETGVVEDLVQTSIDGTQMVVFISPRRYWDIRDVEICD